MLALLVARPSRIGGRSRSGTWICTHLIAYVGSYHICGLLSHIAHIRYQMGTNPGIHVGLIPDLPPIYAKPKVGPRPTRLVGACRFSVCIYIYIYF